VVGAPMMFWSRLETRDVLAYWAWWPSQGTSVSYKVNKPTDLSLSASLAAGVMIR
jgi:hypothetical protein